MSEYATRLESGTDTAPRLRTADALQMAPGTTDPLSARTGIRPGGGAVTVSAGTMDVEVAPFSGWVDGGASVEQAGYPVVLDAAKPLTLADGHATLDRVDTIAAVVSDDVFDGSGATLFEVTVIEGTPGGGAPTLPDACLPLRDVNVPQGLSAGTGGLTSGNLSTDRRTYTAALGGLLPVGSATERDALTPYDGMPVWRTDSGVLQVWNAATSTWDTFRGSDSGWVNPGILGEGDGVQVGRLDDTTGGRMRKIGNRVTLELHGGSLTYTSAGGNIADIDLATLPAGFRPAANQYVLYVTTKASGSAVIHSSGLITLRTLASPGIDAGDDIWLHCSFLTD